jgi:hypothetical protein
VEKQKKGVNMTNQTQQNDNAALASATKIRDNAKKIRIKPNYDDSKAKLSQIKNDLTQLIDTIVLNPSLFSRAANYWGKRPLWQKIAVGIILVAPPLIMGFIANMLLCFVIMAFTLAIYSSTSFLLDDHYNQTKLSTENIRSGVMSLAENLHLVTSLLNEISEDLADQVDLFTNENERFGNNIDDFIQQNKALSNEVDALNDTVNKLRKNQEELETTGERLKTALLNQTKELTTTLEELNKLKIQYTHSEEQLRKTTEELLLVRQEFNKEVEEYEAVVQTLKRSLNTLTYALSLEEAQQKEFDAKLNAFINNKEASFEALLTVAQQTQLDLTSVNRQIKEASDEQLKLVAETQAQLQQLAPLAQQLREHGFYTSANDNTSPKDTINGLVLQP